MQEDYYAPYREHLKEGMRVEIGIPLSGGGVFRDWAIISEAAGDELVAQISRDVLPASVRVEVGSILDVSIWIEKDAHTCSAIVTDKRSGRVLRVRLFGKFTLRERRQFFRISLELAIKYAFIADAGLADIKADWEQRKNLEHMKFQGYDGFVIAAHQARHQPAVQLEWHEMRRAELNLGGGGIFVRLPDIVHPEELLALEIFLPLNPPRLVHTVARVIHVMTPRVQRGSNRYLAGLQFVYLDERDRDLLFKHISVTQIALLRKATDLRDLPEPVVQGSGAHDWPNLARRGVLALLLLVAVFLLVRYLIHYKEEGSPNEIGQTYQKALKHYRHQD